MSGFVAIKSRFVMTKSTFVSTNFYLFLCHNKISFCRDSFIYDFVATKSAQ